MVLIFLCYFKGNKMLQKLLNYLFKKQIFTKDLTEMTADETSFFDKSYNDALNETMEYILSKSKNSLFVSTN